MSNLNIDLDSQAENIGFQMAGTSDIKQLSEQRKKFKTAEAKRAFDAGVKRGSQIFSVLGMANDGSDASFEKMIGALAKLY